MNLEKKRGNQYQIRKLMFDRKEINDDYKNNEVLNEIKSFYKTLFKNQLSKNVREIQKC